MINLLLDSNMDVGSALGILAFFGGSLLIMLGIVLVVYMIIVGIPRGFLFKKAGFPFWKSLVPFYGMYCYHKIIGLPVSFTIGYFIAGGVTGTGLLAIIGGLAIIIMNIVCASRTARAFNLSTIWAVLVYFMGPIAYLIIGLSRSISYGYSSPTPRMVPVNGTTPTMNFDPNTGQPINNAQPAMNFDPNTGQPITQVGTMPVAEPQTEAPTEAPQVNSDLPDSIESIIIKQ